MEFSPFIFDSTFLRYEAEMCSVPSHHHSLTQAFFALREGGVYLHILSPFAKVCGPKKWQVYKESLHFV